MSEPEKITEVPGTKRELTDKELTEVSGGAGHGWCEDKYSDVPPYYLTMRLIDASVNYCDGWSENRNLPFSGNTKKCTACVNYFEEGGAGYCRVRKKGSDPYAKNPFFPF